MHTHCGIIHTDMKPENVLVTISDKDTKELACRDVMSPSAGGCGTIYRAQNNGLS